ncbi:MAG: hypothetical protein HZA46_20345 [Planctomycetales bacterium]|nr:hypothetical protein [Planctomycetales bacterium]
MPLLIHAITRPDLPPFRMPDRFRHEITYFMTPAGEHGVPTMPTGEYWVRLEDSRTALDDGVFRLVSPLDTDRKAEIEISEEQEAWLEWMVANRIEHIRVGP